MNYFLDSKAIIGMIHVEPLPGTPRYKGSMNAVIEKACTEALLYKKAGLDMIAVENMHDIPYMKGNAGAEVVAAMAVVAYEVKKAAALKCGIQILAGANCEALSVALSAGLDFIRAEGYVFAHVADEGIIEGCAGELLRKRRALGCEGILILADIKKKHSSHAITADVDIAETAKAASFFMADGVIVTGASTGSAASLDELRAVKQSVLVPVLIGSGITIDNFNEYLDVADALIVGSWFKYEGRWDKTVDYERASRFMEKVRNMRK
jgi:membrane complex biogenesis BtpA family protein